jgi:hypothetical protein
MVYQTLITQVFTFQSRHHSKHLAGSKSLFKMFSSVAALVLLAASVVNAGPLPDIDPRDIAEPMPLVAREFEMSQLAAREPESFELEDRDLEARAGKQIKALATFDTLLAGADTLRAIGNYGALQWQGIST